MGDAFGYIWANYLVDNERMCQHLGILQTQKLDSAIKATRDT